MSYLRYLIILVLPFAISACGTMAKDLKNFFAGKSSAESTATTSYPRSSGAITFSEEKNIPVSNERSYQRMTRKQFEAEELSGERAGSLWVMEGQDSYLFSENIVRLPGDLLNVVLEGQPEKQLSTKVKVITDLTKKLEDRRRKLASAPNVNAAPKEGEAAAATPGAEKVATEKQANTEETTVETPFDVKEIPVRIVERMADGNYRVKGSQTFMIGSKEYRVIATGLVKPGDVNHNRVESSKMLDSKFDIVKYK